MQSHRPSEGGQKQVPLPRAQGSGKRRSAASEREHVFPACSWDLPPMAPFPLALFLISGNHLPLLLLLTACDSIFSSLSGRKKINNLHLPDRSPQPPPGEPATHPWRRHEPPSLSLHRTCLTLLGALCIYSWFWTPWQGGEAGSDRHPSTPLHPPPLSQV